jgi:hypothetical protein
MVDDPGQLEQENADRWALHLTKLKAQLLDFYRQSVGADSPSAGEHVLRLDALTAPMSGIMSACDAGRKECLRQHVEQGARVIEEALASGDGGNER